MTEKGVNMLMRAFTTSVVVTVVILIYWSVMSLWNAWAPPLLDCPTAELKLLSFRECLQNRPQCTVDGPKEYEHYHKIRRWAEANCPEAQ